MYAYSYISTVVELSIANSPYFIYTTKITVTAVTFKSYLNAHIVASSCATNFDSVPYIHMIIPKLPDCSPSPIFYY